MTQHLDFGNLKLTQTGHFSFEKREKRWLIDGLWTDAGTGILSGGAKIGKTWISLDAGISVSAGIPFLGKYEVKQGPVILMSPEGPTQELEDRIGRICAYRGIPRPENLWVGTFDKLMIDVPADQELIRRAVHEVRPALIIIDPFVRFFSGTESYTDDVKRATNFLNELAASSGAAILMTHHASKDGQSLRGSGVLLSYGDNYWYLQEDDSENLRLEFTLKHAKDPAPLSVKIDDDDAGNAGMTLCSAPRQEQKVELDDRIMNLLRTDPLRKKQTVEEMRVALGGSNAAYSGAISRLLRLGYIYRQPRGGYGLKPAPKPRQNKGKKPQTTPPSVRPMDTPPGVPSSDGRDEKQAVNG